MKIFIEICFLTQERTRGHEVTLVKDKCRLDIKKNSFSYRTINELNILSIDCVTVSRVNMFKHMVDTYLRRAGYINMKNVGPSIRQWLPCPLAIWVFALGGNLVRSCHSNLSRNVLIQRVRSPVSVRRRASNTRISCLILSMVSRLVQLVRLNSSSAALYLVLTSCRSADSKQHDLPIQLSVS